MNAPSSMACASKSPPCGPRSSAATVDDFDASHATHAPRRHVATRRRPSRPAPRNFTSLTFLSSRPSPPICFARLRWQSSPNPCCFKPQCSAWSASASSLIWPEHKHGDRAALQTQARRVEHSLRRGLRDRFRCRLCTGRLNRRPRAEPGGERAGHAAYILTPPLFSPSLHTVSMPQKYDGLRASQCPPPSGSMRAGFCCQSSKGPLLTGRPSNEGAGRNSLPPDRKSVV